MIISVVSLKGGTGKSTISQNLAVCYAHSGYKVTLVDTDVNGSSLRWSGLRSDDLPRITTLALNDGNALRKNAKLLHADCDIMIIDGTPALSELASTTLLLADIALIPIKPGPLDIWATEKFLEKYENVRTLNDGLSANFVLNQFIYRSNLGQEVVDVLNDMPIPLLKSILHTRVAFSECISGGLGAFEYKDPKAAAESVSLANEVIEILENKLQKK
ncbi:MAG: AAA family ATPase [Bacteroidales bacterium]|nr:AAA family ATPase [Bacteroidales bacterium]MCF8455925.1 AAA family ATPase [Bacteroidales bacterium]